MPKPKNLKDLKENPENPKEIAVEVKAEKAGEPLSPS